MPMYIWYERCKQHQPTHKHIMHLKTFKSFTGMQLLLRFFWLNCSNTQDERKFSETKNFERRDRKFRFFEKQPNIYSSRKFYLPNALFHSIESKRSTDFSKYLWFLPYYENLNPDFILLIKSTTTRVLDIDVLVALISIRYVWRVIH